MTDRILILDFGSHPLMAEAADVFRERGRTALMHWTCRDPAHRKFYQKIGGGGIADGFDDGIPDLACGWRNVARLVGVRAPVGRKGR